MKVALYARVSMEEGDKDNKRYQEPENQLEPLRAWATSQNWEVYKEYVDKGSGADPARVQFREMLKDSLRREFTAILVWKIDRFSREPMNVVVGRVQDLRNRGIAIKSHTESWLDTGQDNPISDVILAVLSWAANEERKKISERTKAGIQRRKNIGQWNGGRPRLLTPEDAKKVNELAVQGKKTDEIAKALNIDRKDIKHWFKRERKGGRSFAQVEPSSETNAPLN